MRLPPLDLMLARMLLMEVQIKQRRKDMAEIENMAEIEKVYTALDHIRMHPDMYYKKLGDGKLYDDCIYQMLQGIIDNSIDEFKMGYGNRIEVSVDCSSGYMSVRDYGRGVPIDWLERCFIAQCCGGMYSSDFDNIDYIKQRRLYGWAGAASVSALSAHFQVRSVRSGKYGRLVVRCGKKVSYDMGECGADEKNGMLVRWTPDTTVLPAFTIVEEHVVRRIKECAAANPGLKFFLNGQEISAV